MKTLSEVPDYSVLKREVQALRKRLEDLESGRMHPKPAGRATRWRRLAAKPALALTAVMGAVLALGVLSAQNKQDPLFIDQNGYVGINQTKPEQPLDVNGNALLRGNAVVGGDLNLGNSVLYFTNTDHRASATALQGGVAAIENSKDRAALEIFGRATPTRTRVVAISDRLGIGTSFPNETLEVGGNAVVSGGLTVSKIQGIVYQEGRYVSMWDRVGIGKLTAEAPLDVKGEIRGKPWISQEYVWKQKDYEKSTGEPTKMTREDHSVCFLTFVSGYFLGEGEAAEIKAVGGYWFLTGKSGTRHVQAKARCIGAPDYSW
jgi:hypothetical protein